MTRKISIPDYTLGEELTNSISHGIGAILGIVGLVFMLIKTIKESIPINIICASIFGTTMILLYTISCIYHALSKNITGKKVLRVLDHCNVFLLVFGTYIPIALIAVGGTLGWVLFSLVGTVTIVGIVLSAIDVDKYSLFEVICHLINGWSTLIVIKPIINNCGVPALLLIILGGVMYSIGAILYGIGSKKRYMHSVFHFFCIFGTLFHFLAIYLYII